MSNAAAGSRRARARAQDVAASSGGAAAPAHGATVAFRAMSAATYPPLKPLSMLTTTTFAEQLLSMVNNGARPANAAP